MEHRVGHGSSEGDTWRDDGRGALLAPRASG